MSSVHDIILKPLMTESTFNLIERENKLVFIVRRNANKKTIKSAVEKLYNVKVEKVNTLIQKNGNKKAFVKLTPEFILKTVSDETYLTIQQIKSKIRDRSRTQARFIFCNLTHRFCNLSLKEIGGHVGGIDHSSVIHGLKIRSQVPGKSSRESFLPLLFCDESVSSPSS